MSGLFGSVTIKGNQITDFAKQTASVGVPIPFGYGRYVAVGQVIWTDDVVTHVTKKKQGKGGVKTEEYTYTRSYAIAFCAGPIYGYLTITRDGKVVYTTDPNAKIEDQDFAAKWAQKVAFYFGTDSQMPDSTIEAKEGTGQVSAFRDLAYIVIENDDVTNGAGAIPNYQAVVVATPPEVYMTSRPYALESLEELSNDMSTFRFQHQDQPQIRQDNVNVTMSVVSVTRFGSLATYNAPNVDKVNVTMNMLSVTRFGSEATYNAPNTDKVNVSAQMLVITCFGGEVSYNAPNTDKVNVNMQMLTITRS